MDPLNAQAALMIERAQIGHAQQVLDDAETILRERTGDLVDGPSAIHFARVVALSVLGEYRRAIAGAEVMAAAAHRENNAGWRSAALSLRAEKRLLLGELEASEHDVDAALRDLVDAEIELRRGVPDPFVAGHAHTGVGLGYSQLRLYELAAPHFQAAYDSSVHSDWDGGDGCMWLLNLTHLHLNWALELHRVGQSDQAAEHYQEAARQAAAAHAAASGPDDGCWRDLSSLLGGCARAGTDDPAAALAEIEHYGPRAVDAGIEVEYTGTAPFHAVALRRTGHQREALALIEGAIANLAASAPWTAVAACHHTRAELLADAGSVDARAALTYGDTLAQALWRQRERTLHIAQTMQSYESLRVDHERVARDALTDPLTGMANRRAFDEAVAALRDFRTADQPVGVLLIDLDRFKEVNDTFGHDAGDEVLRHVAAALTANLRDGDLVARRGGDEFAALLPGATLTAAHTVAARMVAAVDAIEGCLVTASIGIAGSVGAGVGDAVRQADLAMYAAKRRGGNRVGGGSAA